MSAISKPTLYGYWRSSCTWRLRIALNLKKIPYDYKVISVIDGEQFKPEFLAINPRGLVPVLDFGNGTVIADSLAIIEYLEEKYPDTGVPLLPKSPEARAVVRSLTYLVTSGIQPLQNNRVMKYVSGGDPDKMTDHCKHFITIGFDAFEKELSKSAGKYAVGDELSLVDLVIPSQVNNAHRFNVDMSKYPTINRINATLAEIPEFIAADAWHQPDTPENLRRP
uniref:maleylacetoacetate isomerase n=1 Tax=Panagrellus redivivus TaxID=6233 RepID=A0A7E4W695_PANRE